MRKYKLNMLEASKILKSETEALLTNKFRRVNSNAPNCQCGRGRMILRESTHGFFWGCNAFPTCFSNKSLSKIE